MENGIYLGPQCGSNCLSPGPALYCDQSARKDILHHRAYSVNFHPKVAANNGLDGVLTLVASTSVFFNECEVHFRFDWRSIADLPPDVNVQVLIIIPYCLVSSSTDY